MSTSLHILRFSKFGSWIAAGALLIPNPKPVMGQSTFGAVVGGVTDSQNAVITSAAIKLTEVQTNVVRSAQTTAFGTYEFVNINQGQYVVEVEKEGFAGYKTQPFEVAARQTVRIDAELRPAGVQQAVQIMDSAPLVNTENPTIASASRIGNSSSCHLFSACKIHPRYRLLRFCLKCRRRPAMSFPCRGVCRIKTKCQLTVF